VRLTTRSHRQGSSGSSSNRSTSSSSKDDDDEGTSAASPTDANFLYASTAAASTDDAVTAAAAAAAAVAAAAAAASDVEARLKAVEGSLCALERSRIEEQWPSKVSVAAALHRKANKDDVAASIKSSIASSIEEAVAAAVAAAGAGGDRHPSPFSPMSPHHPNPPPPASHDAFREIVSKRLDLMDYALEESAEAAQKHTSLVLKVKLKESAEQSQRNLQDALMDCEARWNEKVESRLGAAVLKLEQGAQKSIALAEEAKVTAEALAVCVESCQSQSGKRRENKNKTVDRW
jgi:hypothetical protein